MNGLADAESVSSLFSPKPGENKSMWACPTCNESVDEQFVVCWNCGTDKDGVPDPTFEHAVERRESESSKREDVQPAAATSQESSLQGSSGTFSWGVAVPHFFLASFVLMKVLASAYQPVSSSSDDWLLLPFLVLLFPANILGLLGLFRLGFISMLAVPIATAFWGFVAGRMINAFKGT